MLSYGSVNTNEIVFKRINILLYKYNIINLLVILYLKTIHIYILNKIEY